MEMFDNTEVAYARMTNYELRRAFVLFKALQVALIFKTIKFFVKVCFRLHVPIDWLVKPTVFKQFIGGVNTAECLPIATSLETYKVKAILDYSAEDGEHEETVAETLRETLNSIEIAANHKNIAFAVFKPTAFCPKYVLTAMSGDKPVNGEIKKMADKFSESVNLLCKKAYDNNIPIMIDAEDFAFQAFIDKVVTDMMVKYNGKQAIVYNTLQMYRTDRLEFLENSFTHAKENNYYLGIKLVRGAYLERERLRAAQMGYASPIWPDKKSTDDAFDKAQEYCIDHIDRISLFSGSHNEYSNMYLMDLLKKNGLQNNDSRVYFSQLYGMSDNITFNLARQNYNVAKYIPYGPVRKVLPYLIRRADENSAVAGQTCRELNFIHKELKRRKNN